MKTKTLKECDPRDLLSFAELEGLVKQFEQVLQKHGIQVKASSVLERICVEILELQSRHRKLIPHEPCSDVRHILRPALGLIDLVRRVVRLAGHPDFRNLVPHLRLMNEGTVVQNVPAPADRVSDKIFELLMGLICLEVGQNCLIDHPVNSRGDNPDVLVTLDARRWGFACKVPAPSSASWSPISFFNQLEKGIQQIEDSTAEIGCVVFNLKNIIDHNTLWPVLNPDEFKNGAEPEFGAWRTLETPLAKLLDLTNRVQHDLITVNSRNQTEALFKGKKAIPGALLFLQTAVSLHTVQGPVPTTLGVFVLMNPFGLCQPYHAVLDRLNDVLHHR